MDSVLSFCDENPDFAGKPVYLFGHSLGGYAVTAVLNYHHRVDAVVSASGFDNASDQWECSIKRFTGPAYFLIRPLNLAFIRLKYGDEAIAYQKSNPQNPIDKQLYMQHDKKILQMIVDFFEMKEDN